MYFICVIETGCNFFFFFCGEGWMQSSDMLLPVNVPAEPQVPLLLLRVQRSVKSKLSPLCDITSNSAN